MEDLLREFSQLENKMTKHRHFDMSDHDNNQRFIDKKDGDKVFLITMFNDIPVAFMIVRDLTEKIDKYGDHTGISCVLKLPRLPYTICIYYIYTI